MKTWKNREGKYVSEKPKEFCIGTDKRGNELFIGDIIINTDTKYEAKIEDKDLRWWFQHYCRNFYKKIKKI
jgi:hypothetical protein